MPDSEVPSTKLTHIEIDASEVLFDMDGTLLDSIKVVESAWQTLAKEFSVVVPNSLRFHGRTATDLVASLIPPELANAAIARLEELESSPTEGISTLPGARRLLEEIPATRWSIVTSATRPVAEARIAAAHLKVPQKLVTGDDVLTGKPKPEPFIAGRRHNGPAVAIEDTIAGLTAAREAGCTTIAVTGTHGKKELAPYSDFVVSSLTQISVREGGKFGLVISLEAV